MNSTGVGMDRVAISWGIRTNRKKEWKLVSMIASILAQAIDPENLEILICGDTEFTCLDGEMAKHVRLISDPQSAHTGRTSVMMNRMAREAKHSWICISDDDMIYCDGWYDKVCQFLSDHPHVDLCAFPLRNVDGSRFWDWAIHTEGRSQLIDPRVGDPRLYVTGGLLLMRREIWEANPWDETLGFYEGEDTEWSQRAIRSGANVALCTGAYAVHNDWRYLQVGPGVIRARDIKETMAAAGRPLANGIYGQYLTEAAKSLDGVCTFLNGLRWETLPGLDPNDKGKLAEIIHLLGQMEGEIGRLNDVGKQLAALAV
jgi:hypothetical protein